LPSHRREEPNDAAIAPEGSVYGREQDNPHIVQVDPNGVVINTVGTFGTGTGQPVQPRGLAVDTAANLCAADCGSNRVAVFARVGAFLTEWGEASPNCEPRSPPFCDPTDSTNGFGPRVPRSAASTTGKRALASG